MASANTGGVNGAILNPKSEPTRDPDDRDVDLPPLIFVGCYEANFLRYKAIPLDKVRTWEDFYTIVAQLFNLSATQTIRASLEGQPFEPSLWNDFLITGATYSFRIFSTVPLKVKPSEQFNTLCIPSKQRKTTTLERIPVTQSIWELTFLIAQRLTEIGYKGLLAEHIELLFVAPKDAWSSKEVTLEAANESPLHWAGASDKAEKSGAKGKGKASDKRAKMGNFENKTTLKEIMAKLGVVENGLEALTVEVSPKVKGKGKRKEKERDHDHDDQVESASKYAKEDSAVDFCVRTLSQGAFRDRSQYPSPQ